MKQNCLYPSAVRRYLVYQILFAIDDLFESRLSSMQHNPVSPLKSEFS